MNLKGIVGATLLITSLTLVSFKGDKDPLHKRKFIAQGTEYRDGKPKTTKPVEDEIEFKNGKVYSSLCWEKMEFQDIQYEIRVDSTYKDSGNSTEKHYYQVVAITTNDKKETLTMDFIINEYEIEATYKLTKKDLIKKHFTSIGKEKVKKK